MISIAIGIGLQRGVERATLEKAINNSLNYLNQTQVNCIATHQSKSNELGLINLCEDNTWPLKFYSSEQLAQIQVPNPSLELSLRIGTPSVAEAAALLATNSQTLLLPKYSYQGLDKKWVTIAIAKFNINKLNLNI